MKLTDISISARLTIVTTALVLMVFALVAGSVLWSVDGLYDTRTQQERQLRPEQDRAFFALLQQERLRLAEIAGALLAERIGQTDDPRTDSRLSDLIASLQKNPEFSYIDIRDAAERSLTGQLGAPPDSVREFPVARAGQAAGRVLIGIDPELRSAASDHLRERLEAALQDDARHHEIALAQLIAVLLVSALLTGLVFYISIVRLAQRFILHPAERVRDGLKRIRGVLHDMERRRDFSERLEPGAEDELGSTVVAFNRGLDFLERQNDQLNDSIIELLQVSNEISQARDLTLKVPVREDITGPLSDALNRITSESARVLVQVREIAQRVGQAATQVQSQGQRVVEVADTERQEIEQAANELAAAVAAIDRVATLARFCNDAADTATASTSQALTSVKDAVAGMADIRSTIQETGKRIKRLGERSQEIGGIVEIINSFSERTHILAINAAMQAATAGEAGRGFAVVAQEVQRLADSSRGATNQIGTLIANIQVETQNSIQIVNQAAEAVGIESRIVEGAGERMLETQDTTHTLATAVRQIDERAQAQVAANRKLMERVDSMRASTVETTEQLDHQTRETGSLTAYSRQLIEAIQLFRLPAPTDASSHDAPSHA